MDRKLRLETLKKYLEDSIDYHYKFEDIYKKLLSEISTEKICNFGNKKRQYLIELELTLNREAKLYIKSKNKKHADFKEFLSSFRKDVNKGLAFYSEPLPDATIENQEI
jgi:hypothetical protein